MSLGFEGCGAPLTKGGFCDINLRVLKPVIDAYILHQIYIGGKGFILLVGGSTRQGAENVFLEVAKEKQILNVLYMGI